MQEDNAEGVNLKYYIDILIRRKYLALSVGFAVLSICTWGSYFWPKQYQASSTVLIEKSSVIDPLIKDVGVSRNKEDMLGSLKEKMLSRDVVGKVAKQLNVITPSKNINAYDGLAGDLRTNLVITAQGTTGSASDVFTVKYSGRDPRMVRDTVNGLISALIEENKEYRTSDASSAFNFINSQVAEYKIKLDEADKAIREFREKNPHFVRQTDTTMARNVDVVETRHIEAEIRLKEMMRKRENLRKQLSGEIELTGTPSGAAAQQARLTQLNNQLEDLRTKYTENYPGVIKVKADIEELKKEMAQKRTAAKTPGGVSAMSETDPAYQRVKNELAITDSEIASLRARVGDLSRQHNQGQGSLGRMPQAQEEWAKLERDKNVYQKIYDELSQKLESARVTARLENTAQTGAFRILNPAVLPIMPAKPDRVIIILLGLVFGMASGAGSAVGVEYLNRSFKDESDIESLLKLSVLCTIPNIITQEENSVEKERDKLIFIAAGAYLFVIALVWACEFLYRYMGIKTIIF